MKRNKDDKKIREVLIYFKDENEQKTKTQSTDEK